MRAVSVLEVADPQLWAELEHEVALDAHLADALDAHRRVVKPSFERDVLPRLKGRVLVRYARQEARAARERAALTETIANLRHDTRRVLHAAQRHAWAGEVIGRQAWDPQHDAPAVRTLHGAGLLAPVAGDPPYVGRYRLHEDLPDPPAVAYDFTDAVMEETDDLSPPTDGPIALLHDMAALAAALEHLDVGVTLAGTVAKADVKKIAARLGAPTLAGALEADARWGKALRGLQALGAVSIDPAARTLYLDLGLEHTLSGTSEEACDRLLHRVLDRDLHPLVPAVREALRQAGTGAVDELVFVELLRDQHRDVLLPGWERVGVRVYPHLDGEHAAAFDDIGWEHVETRMVWAALSRLERVGILRRAQGVFAGTVDGRRWAGAIDAPHPPVWATGDLELIVPPDALTAWERFQVERLGTCLQRDVVDRYRLERAALGTWLTTHRIEDAVALLERRCPGLPLSVRETFEAWAHAHERVVLTRGVLLDDVTPA